MQAGGPTEAARALRKKLKYGSKHEQLRAVTVRRAPAYLTGTDRAKLLDALSENAGSKFQREFGNEMLLERVRVLVQDQYVDVEVRRRLAAMILNWKALFEGQQGMEHLSNMYHALPKQAVKVGTCDAKKANSPSAHRAPLTTLATTATMTTMMTTMMMKHLRHDRCVQAQPALGPRSLSPSGSPSGNKHQQGSFLCRKRCLVSKRPWPRPIGPPRCCRTHCSE